MVSGLLGLLGASGSGLAFAPALRALSWPLLVITLLMLSRGWYLQISQRADLSAKWPKPVLTTLVLSTVLAVTLWGLRFAGLLGESPI
ncbi:MAG: hypothetical protein LR120_09940 [Dehalococcoidia bacterium]|nr:hypothetical protein [Dehalococcoidia bacterium]MCD5400051.1 hypothetical protein [Dehalococcoidia bacterium]